MPYKNKMEARLKNPIAYGLNRLRYTAKLRRLEFKLSKEWAIMRYKGVCELTGLKFKILSKLTPFSPSIDRIDNDKGYTEDNCRIVLHGVNSLKGNSTDKEMYKIAKALINKRKQKA